VLSLFYNDVKNIIFFSQGVVRQQDEMDSIVTIQEYKVYFFQRTNHLASRYSVTK